MALQSHEDMPSTPEAQVFGQTLKRLRAEKKMTQQTLAGDAGLAITYVSDLERGLKVPSLTTILQLAHALDIEPRELLADFTANQIRRAVRSHLK